ncbi:MAG TPA: DoxX-like family protein, partial [Thermoanaerobaculia bacterium]|nr:DoxX-like family protein [Thermoanaerobaculia bacterium]
AALLLFRRSRALLLASAAGVLALTVAGIVHTPSIATAPFNAVTLTLGMLALTAISLVTMRGAPSATRTRWSAWRKG